MMKKLILCGCLVVIVAACREDENPQFQDYSCTGECYIIEGQILHGQDSIQISNVTLTLTNFINTWNTDLLAIQTSNKDGYYRFDIPKSYFDSPVNSVLVNAMISGFVNSPYGASVRLDSSNVNAPIQNDFTLYAASSLIIEVTNNPNTDFGSVSISCDFDLENVSDVGRVMHDSPSFIDNFEFKVPSDLPFKFSWRTYGTNLVIQGEWYVTVPRNESRTLTIEL